MGKEERKEGKKEKTKREKHLSSENVDSVSIIQRKAQPAGGVSACAPGAAAAAPASLGVDRNSPASWTVSDTRIANRAAESLPDGSRPKFYFCLNAVKTWLVFPQRMELFS